MAKAVETTKIMPCTCVNTYQDAKYGPNNRVFNYGPKIKSGTHRCTVCGRTS